MVPAARGSNPPCRLLADQEAGEGAYSERFLDARGIERFDRAAYARAGVVDDDGGLGDIAGDGREQAFDLRRIDRVARIRASAGLRAQVLQLGDVAGREGDPHPFAREQPRQRRRQTAAGAHDQCNLGCHGRLPLCKTGI